VLAPPSEQTTYTAQVDISQPVVAQDKRLIAQLENPVAAGVKNVLIYVPDKPGPDAEQAVQNPVYYTVLASVEYQFASQRMLVTTSQPSADAAQMSTAFGDEQVQLGDNVTAWTTTNSPGELSNRVVFVQGDTIVSLIGNMSIDELKVLATQIVVQ
jgi:hypothetical protein